MTGGFGYRVRLVGIQFVVCMTCWHRKINPCYIKIWSWFDINRYLWKFLYLLGVCWGTGYQLNKFWQVVGFYMWRRGHALMGVGMSRIWIIFFCLVLILVRCGRWCELSLVLLGSKLSLYQTISCNLLIMQVAWERDARFFI